MSTMQLGKYEDVQVGVRLKIASLWIAMLFLFAYGDIFGFFAPGHIEEIRGGRISGMEITQTFLLEVSVYIAIASAMVFLTLVLRPPRAAGSTSCSRRSMSSRSPHRCSERTRTSCS
jgi:Family of unknown function (DUF6326)